MTQYVPWLRVKYAKLWNYVPDPKYHPKFKEGIFAEILDGENQPVATKWFDSMSDAKEWVRYNYGAIPIRFVDLVGIPPLADKELK